MLFRLAMSRHRPAQALFYQIPLGAQYYVAARQPPHPSASRIL